MVALVLTFTRYHFRLLAAAACAVTLAIHPAAASTGGSTQDGGTEIAAALSLSGDEAVFGRNALEGLQLALDEENARGGPRLILKTYDEQSNVEQAKRVAHEIVASRAPFVLGSVFTIFALAEGPIYARAGMPALATATSDFITRDPTTFRVLYSTSEQGQVLANYLGRALRLHRATVIAVDDGYGRSLRSGFATGAARVGLRATYHRFKTIGEAVKVARTVAADKTSQAVVLLMLDTQGAPVLAALRRAGVKSAILGANAFSEQGYIERLEREPEEQRRRGALSDGSYAVSSMMLDSANAQILAFADRFRAKFHHDPTSVSAEWYELGTLAAAAVRATAHLGDAEPATMRSAALAYFSSLNNPGAAVPGLLGPIWFDRNRGRTQAIRMARYSGGVLESAPLQIVPVTKPSVAELQSGAVFELAPGRYGRLQRVVYAGIYLNQISHIDLPRSSFGADFYVWLRFATKGGADSLDPADINFPNMVSGSFDPARPAEVGEMPDGTEYRLWRVQGEFRNDFDLHAFPFDRQRLQLPFFNARGASDRIVYVLDRRTLVGGGPVASAPQVPPIASPTAFTELTQWDAIGGTERRENLVTYSSLGDPRNSAAEGYRELAGFIATYDVKRRALSTVVKTLMPLLLMTLIIYTTLFFPAVLIKEKVTVAVTGALSGAVLLTAVNSQLGAVGYTIAIEYAFFVFFGLTTFSIIAALLAQRLRGSDRHHHAMTTERATQLVFALAVLAVLAGAWWVSTTATVQG